ncbi:LysR substrate-binding domain-containing protein [Mangrovicoccus ximenensis]|uniref:LysR substrate-binding domain-containing protein n=1 Tax=Mangrovicoccus ximenensis TaxID=1911570 RepID=UPI000D3BAD57|nr:LysR substrate-binding domain-containing protein [Mangrovicoccus ximenensis]
MPTLRQLRYLVAIADTLHFRRAAERCGVTQPTLSAQLKDLELRLGTRLLDRSRSGAALTPAGREIVERSRKVLGEIEEIRFVAQSGQDVLGSAIRVGVVQSTGSYLLPHVIPSLHEAYPKLGFYIHEGLPDQLLRDLQDSTLDLLFFPLPVRSAEFETLSLCRETIGLVMPWDHPLAAETVIGPGMLRGETILSLSAAHRLQELVQAVARDHGATLLKNYEGTSLDTLRQMVAMGMGLSLMPALYIRSEVEPQDIVVARRFRSPEPTRTIGMVWRRGTSRQDEFLLLFRLICRILKERVPELTVLG